MNLRHFQCDTLQVHTHLVGRFHLYHTILGCQIVVVDGVGFTCYLYEEVIGGLAVDVGHVADAVGDVSRRSGGIDVYLHAFLHRELETRLHL